MTLTELTYYGRKSLPFVALFFIVFMAFFYAVKLLLSLDRPDVQPTYVNTVFGNFKKPEVRNATPSAGFTFKLDTVEGEPVTATDTAKVFFLPSQSPRFGYREKIYLMANTFGFNTQVVKHKLVDADATFVDGQQSLDIDIKNFNFTYKYNFEKNQALFTDTTIPTQEVAQNKAIDLLKLIGRYPDELAKGKVNVIYLHYDPVTDNLSVVQRPPDANLVEVDFYRPDIDAIPSPISIVSPKFFNSQNYVLLLFHEKEVKLLKAQVNFYDKSDEQVGVYPLLSGNEAWNKLKSGNGMVIVSAKKGPITIKKMFLGYLDPDFYQDYLQPVYVFLGDNNFVSYVPAISDSYLQ